MKSLTEFLMWAGVCFDSSERGHHDIDWRSSVENFSVALTFVHGLTVIDPLALFARIATFDGLGLAHAKVDAISKIDAAAEARRLKYVTPGEGQAMVYIQKQAEAERYLAAGSPADLTGYPLLAARAATTGTSAATVAAEWLASAAAWAAIAAQIETVRETAKASVALATTEAEISAIVSGLVWPS